MPAVDAPLVINFIWIIGCAIVTFYLLKQRPWRPLPSVVIILITAFIVRAIPALIMQRGAVYEMYLFQQTAHAFRNGENIYLSQFAHPYLPFLVYWFGFADWLTETVGVFFIFWLKSINILADTLLAGLVYFSVRYQRDETEARYAAWIYVFNPVTILVVAYQGQFEATTTFFLLSAWFLLAGEKSDMKRLFFSALMLGLAILSKTWPIIFLPMVWFRLPNWKTRVPYSLLVGLIPLTAILLYELLFPGSIGPILKRASRAGAISGWWGYSSIINVWLQLTGQGNSIFSWVSLYGKYIGYLFGFFVIIWTRKRPLLYSLLLTILVMFAFVPNLGLQGLAWVIPIALILGLYNSLGWYIIGATIHMLVSYWGIHLTRWLDFFLEYEQANQIIQLSSLTAWLIIVLWCLQEIGQKQLLPRIFTADSQP